MHVLLPTCNIVRPSDVRPKRLLMYFLSFLSTEASGCQRAPIKYIIYQRFSHRWSVIFQWHEMVMLPVYIPLLDGMNHGTPRTVSGGAWWLAVPHLIHCFFGPHQSPLQTASRMDPACGFCSARLCDRGQTDDRPRHGTSVGIGRILHYVQAMRPKIYANSRIAPSAHENINVVDGNVCCHLLVIESNRIGHTIFRRFPKTYFRFLGRHVDTSGTDVTELYTALDSPGSPGQCLQSASPSFKVLGIQRRK